MASNERPGVFTSYEVNSALTGSGLGNAVGLVAMTGTANAAASVTVSSYADAASKFGVGSNATELTRLLLLNGAPVIIALTVKNGATTTDYTDAFNTLKNDENIRILVCDSHSTAVHAAMLESISTAPENCKHRIGVVGSASTVQQLKAIAMDLNSERMLIVSPVASVNGTDGIAGSTAAALAGVIAAGNDPALPLNGAELYGLGGLSRNYSDSDIDALVLAGVTPLETVGGRVSVVRGITSRSRTGGVTDATWRELTTTLILDDVITTVRNSLRTRFTRAKNTVQTRGAIRTQVIIELESKLTREIIDSYGAVTVTPSDSDPTVCEVSFEFAVAHGLNRIYLTAHITV